MMSEMLSTDFHDSEETVRETPYTQEVPSSYWNTLKKMPLLSSTEEKELAEKVTLGDMEARDKMIKSNLRLVRWVASKYMNRGLPIFDLIQEGNIGLIKAVEHFKPNKGIRFSTYATLWIKRSIERALANLSRTIRLPVHISSDLNRFAWVAKSLLQEFGRDPTDEEISRRMKVTVEYVRKLRGIVKKTYPINGSIRDEYSDQLFGLFEDTERSQRVSSWLEFLTDVERMVITLRFGLNDEDTLTLESIGKRFGVTRERIRQIEVKAIEKLRKITKKSAIEFAEMI
jgi:RNA polymerase primary sigma factor